MASGEQCVMTGLTTSPPLLCATCSDKGMSTTKLTAYSKRRHSRWKLKRIKVENNSFHLHAWDMYKTGQFKNISITYRYCLYFMNIKELNIGDFSGDDFVRKIYCKIRAKNWSDTTYRWRHHRNWPPPLMWALKIYSVKLFKKNFLMAGNF